MRIYYVRHGQTDWNKNHFLQGGTDIPLNEKGREDALITGRALSDIPFDLCIASPLERARQTAMLILSENRTACTGLEWPAGVRAADGKICFFTDERLREYCFGVWEGQCLTGPDKTIPIENYSDFWSDFDNLYNPEGSEAKSDFYSRVGNFLDEVNGLYGKTDANILVVSHGGVSRAVRYLLSGDKKSAAAGTRNCEALVLKSDTDGHIFIEKQQYLGEVVK